MSDEQATYALSVWLDIMEAKHFVPEDIRTLLQAASCAGALPASPLLLKKGVPLLFKISGAST